MTDIEKKELTRMERFFFISIDMVSAVHVLPTFGFLLEEKDSMRNASHPIQSHSLFSTQKPTFCFFVFQTVFTYFQAKLL